MPSFPPLTVSELLLADPAMFDLQQSAARILTIVAGLEVDPQSSFAAATARIDRQFAWSMGVEGDVILLALHARQPSAPILAVRQIKELLAKFGGHVD